MSVHAVTLHTLAMLNRLYSLLLFWFFSLFFLLLAYAGRQRVDYIRVIVIPTQCLRIRCGFFLFFFLAQLIERLSEHTHLYAPGVGITPAAL